MHIFSALFVYVLSPSQDVTPREKGTLLTLFTAEVPHSSTVSGTKRDDNTKNYICKCKTTTLVSAGTTQERLGYAAVANNSHISVSNNKTCFSLIVHVHQMPVGMRGGLCPGNPHSVMKAN